MKIKISLLRKFPKIFLVYSICVVAVIVTYMFQIEEDNYYTGMLPLSINIYCFGVLVAGLLVISFISMRTRGLPSEFFLIFYSSIVGLSFISLNSSFGNIDGSRLLFSFFLIFFPLIAVWIAGKINYKINFNGLLSRQVIEGIVFGIVVVVSVLTVLNHPSSAGMDIVSSLDRRMEGRDLYGDGSLMAYALAMTMNGLTPYLGYKAGVLNRKLLLFSALGFDVLFFWLLGVKAPILYVLLAYFVGVLIVKNKHANFTIYFPCAIVLMFSINLVEWLFFDYSFVSDFFFRRLFAVQAQIQGYYLDFIIETGTTSWSFLTGSASSTFKPTFHIGEFYFGDTATNANTNAFLYAFSLNGFFGYIFSALFIVVAFAGVDALYRSSRNPAYLYLGFIYGLLLVEQAFTTALLSSGVGLLFLLVLLEKHEIPTDLPAMAGKNHDGGILL